jgi:hypothetical protein
MYVIIGDMTLMYVIIGDMTHVRHYTVIPSPWANNTLGSKVATKHKLSRNQHAQHQD